MVFTLDDVPDQTGKTVIITGASSGLGLSASRQLASKGAHVIMACRSISKAEPLAAEINDKGVGKATLLCLDTTDLDTIDSFAASLADEGITHLDGIILNAGIMHVDYRTIQSRSTQNPDVESQMFCNVLGHFYLVHVLHDVIVSSPGCRVVSVSSITANTTQVKDSVEYDVVLGRAPEKYNAFRAYTQSKLANQWVSRELQRRLQSAGVDAVSVCAHPGYSRTALQGRTEGFFMRMVSHAMTILSMSAEGGGLILCAAYAMDLSDKGDAEQLFFGPGGFMEFVGAPVATCKVIPQARDEQQAQQLWECLEDLCGVKSQF